MGYRLLLMVLLALVMSAPIQAKVRVIASTNDLAYFAREVGGDLVEVKSIASPKSDLHFVEVRPSYIVKARDADLVLTVGLGLDAWMQQIIDGSRNRDLDIVDCSKYASLLEVSHGEHDARHGHVHVDGNPHYWLLPDNVEGVTRAVSEGLQRVDSDNAAAYETYRAAYLERLNEALPALRARAAPLSGVRVVFYHDSWPYFNAFTGLVPLMFVEELPGVPPSPAHVAELIEHLQREPVKIIAMEPYFDKRVPNRVASATGAAVIELYPSIGGRESGETYLEFLQGNIDALLEGLP